MTRLNSDGPAGFVDNPPQVDYRADPSHGQSGQIPAQLCPDYDHPNAGGYPVAPPEDEGVRWYDLGDELDNALAQHEPKHVDGFSPSAQSALAWERAGATGAPKP